MNLVSIIIPVFNAQKFIQNTIKNLLTQSYENIQVILIDDASTDGTVSEINRFLGKDDRFKLICLDKNSGPGVARNVGLKEAKGDYILFIDADDYFNKQMISDLVNIAKKTKSDIVQASYFVEQSGSKKKIQHVDQIQIIEGKYNCQFEYATSIKTDVYLWSKLYKRELLKDLWFPKKYYSEDQVFNVKAFEKCHKMIIIPQAYYTYGINPNSIVRSKFNERKLHSIDAMKEIIEWYEGKTPELSGFYAKKICLYVIKFYKEVVNSTLENKEKISKKMKKDYKKYYSLYTNSMAKNYTKRRVHLYLWGHRYFWNFSQILLLIKGKVFSEKNKG